MDSVMEWGVKASFHRYVLTAGDGKVTATDGAVMLPDGGFSFAGGHTSEAGELHFTGDLRFSAHQGMLFLMVHDPWLTQGDNGWELSVTDIGHWPLRTHRMLFANLSDPTTTDSGLVYSEVLITEEASLDFGGNYPAGTALDPIRVVIDAV